VKMMTCHLLLRKRIWEPVWINQDLDASMQCTKAANKAMHGLVKQTFKYINKTSFLTLYKSYIRPHLEYCTQVWYPYKVKDIDILEKVQRATRLVPELANQPYESRLRQLGLHSLYCRRLQGDLIATYKLINNGFDINFSSFFTVNKDLPTRGHNFKLFKPSENLQLRQKYFSNHVITPWNNLPNYVVTAINLNDFKNKLDNYWTVTGYGRNQRP